MYTSYYHGNFLVLFYVRYLFIYYGIVRKENYVFIIVGKSPITFLLDLHILTGKSTYALRDNTYVFYVTSS